VLYNKKIGSQVQGDIINTPLSYEEWGFDDDSTNIAAEPDGTYE